MLNIYLTYHTAIPLLGTYPREMKVYMIIPRPACKHSLQYYSQYTRTIQIFMSVWLYKILENFRFSSEIVQIGANLGQGHREG